MQGNYKQYYGYRSMDRLAFLKTLNLQGDVLDIGCNSGHLTVELAKLEGLNILGIDSDKSLVKKAWNHASLEFSLLKNNLQYFPLSCPITLGSVQLKLPVKFKCVDIVTDDFKGSFDVVMCLSVTKWIHKSYGDEGISKLFEKVLNLLKTKGIFILEPQLYAGKYKILPKDFCEYLIKLGFKLIETCSNADEFKRPIYVFIKE